VALLVFSNFVRLRGTSSPRFCPSSLRANPLDGVGWGWSLVIWAGFYSRPVPGLRTWAQAHGEQANSFVARHDLITAAILRSGKPADFLGAQRSGASDPVAQAKPDMATFARLRKPCAKPRAIRTSPGSSYASSFIKRDQRHRTRRDLRGAGARLHDEDTIVLILW